VALVRTDISEEHISSIIRVTRTGALATMLAVTSNLSMLKRNTNNMGKEALEWDTRVRVEKGGF
jgi:hypothetical protein